MKLYNTLTRQLDDVTSEDGIIRMYVCGVTPYDTTHLGHAFTYVQFDVLERYLEYIGFETLTVQNVTDIDDDILREAKKRDMDWHELAMQETEKYLTDMRALNVREPDHFPYATQEIEKMLEMVQTLIDSGRAYERGGSVYYDVSADGSFGKLVDWDYDKMLEIANERGNFPDDPNKDDPLDFVLWQAAKPGEPTWDSPWGEGRPGWHIECSAMSVRYLGAKIDIHAGGADLVFPHHECEIVQSEGYSGESPFVRFWFHTAMVRLENEKMSKSLGNMIFVRDLLEEFSPDAIRLYLLNHKYRDEWAADGASTELAEAEKMVSNWQQAATIAGGSGPELVSAPYEEKFRLAMDHDFDTPAGIKALEGFANTICDGAADGQDVSGAQEVFQTLVQDVLGLWLDEDQVS